ncbi:hypothetical protein M422DRAFT_247835 [Sphaerobolus stellatus SS14]|nr:hypothetical protein M422DRAFT_247835 [Sphaerobolus stellatus SS14]
MPASPNVQVAAIRPDEAFISSEVDPEELARNSVRSEELEKELGGQRRTLSADKLVQVQKELEKFIHAVTCFSVLPTEALGWDPTISMFHRKHCAYCVSYVSMKGVGSISSPYMIQRVIQTPGTHPKNVPIRSLSLIDVEMMRGRVTIVLEVVGYEDYVAGNPEQAQIFVMKQSWQRLPLKNNYNINQVIALENSSLLESDIPPSLPSDGDSRVDQGSLKDRIHCSVYVKDRNGEIFVDIMLTIRKGLTGTPGTIESNIPSKRPIELADREKFIYEQTIETTW